MTKSGNLWAVGYDDMGRANQVRDEIISLGWDKHYLILDDVAVVVRHPDGSFTLDRKAFPAASNVLGCSVVGFLAGLVLGAPLVGATIGAMVGGAGTAVSASVGIGDDFVTEVKGLMKPGTSAIFVLDAEGDMDVLLHAIRGRRRFFRTSAISLSFVMLAPPGYGYIAPRTDVTRSLGIVVGVGFGL